MNPFRTLLFAASLVSLFACAGTGRAEQANDGGSADSAPGTMDEVTGDRRIIAVGDVHGDADQFFRLLKSLQLVDAKLNWAGGATHLVQLGDIPDRGPDSRKVMELLIELQEQAKQQGGQVTVLIGNHEAMMMTGDLRYVHAGEYAAFKDRNSRKRRKAYYQQTLQRLKDTLPKKDLPRFDKAYRKAWEARFPLGYVEHRLAWAPSGKYGKWVLSRPAVVRIDDTLFVHGGISPKFATMSISDINTRVRTALTLAEQMPQEAIAEDPDGPLWDRGWISRLQTPENTELLNQVLAEYQASRMVVGHTPVAPIIVPRFGGKVLVADVGLAEHYGNGFAALEIKGGQATMLVNGQRLEIPNNEADFDSYFDAAVNLVDSPEKIFRYRKAVAESLQRAKKKKTVERTAQ